jgi:peptidoglycan/xylan/chitin deacetylase (PgdA/CDA1 family)
LDTAPVPSDVVARIVARGPANTYDLPVDRRRFLTRAGLVVGGGLAGAAGTAGVEEYRLRENVAMSGHAVGHYRPAGIAATTITYRAPIDAAAVALTFDDGPSNRYTGPILDILDRYDTPATFFLIGEHALRYPSLVQRAATRHEIGNHTWSHPDMSLASPHAATAELTRAANAISALTGHPPIAFRPPYGAFSGATAMVATGLGYPIVLWDFEFDQHGESATTNLDRMVRMTRPGSIILGHDGGTLNCDVVVDVLPSLIDGIRRRGFDFVPLSNLLTAARRQPVTPNVADHADAASAVRSTTVG